jgi:hypothetical protein
VKKAASPASSHVGLGDHRVAGFGDQPSRLLEGTDHRAAGDPDPGGPVDLLHGGLPLDDPDPVLPQPVHVEIGPKARLGLQPMLAVGVDPVELPVEVGEVPERPDQRVVRVHVVHAVIFGERPAEFRPQRLVRGVGQPKDVHPFLPEPDAEAVVVRRKMRGEIDEIHRLILAGAGGTVKPMPEDGIDAMAWTGGICWDQGWRERQSPRSGILFR